MGACGVVVLKSDIFSVKRAFIQLIKISMKTTFLGTQAMNKGAATITALALILSFVPALNIAQAATLFSDGFESDSFTNWTSSNGVWDVTNGGANSGSKKAEAKGDTGSSDDVLQKNISTSGKQNMVLGYAYKIAAGLGASDHVRVEWSTNGTTWNPLADYTNINSSNNYVQATHSLPSGAANQSGFRFRFRATMNSNGDTFYLDDVSLTADAIPTTASLTVIKHVVTDNGGTATAGNWNLAVSSSNGGTGTGNAAGSESGTTYTLQAGKQYSVAESGGPSGYSQSSSSDCTIASATAGGSYTCTITNDDQPGHLTIVKNTVGGDGLFLFTVSGPSASTPNVQTLGLTGTTGALTVNAGTYSIAEGGGGSWNLTSATCDDGSSSLSGSTVSGINVPLGANVTCTFTNTKKGSITVSKDVVGPEHDGQHAGVSDSHPFNVTLDSNQKTISEGASKTYSELTPGTYTIAEIGDPDFDLLRISGDNDNNAANGAPVVVTAGQDTAVTVTNAQRSGHLTVIKHVNHPNGGTAAASEFTMSVSGTHVSTPSFPGNDTEGTTVTLDPGEFSVGETGPNGYSLYSNAGTCSGTIGSNGNLTCTKTNSDIPLDHGAITVIKHVVNTHGGGLSASNFTIHVTNDGIDVSGSPASGTELGQLFTLASSTSYTVSEDTPASGYAETGISCVPIGGGDTLIGETSVTIANLPDQKAYICTITNDDLPGTLHVVKTLINDNGGTAVKSDFSFSVNQDTPVAFNENGQNDITVNAGDYSVTETATSTYTTTYSNDKNKNSDCSNIHIANGGSATCTITNTFHPTPRDVTAPVSTFDDSRVHQTIDTEIVQLSLVSQSTDNVGPAEDPKSGVASAKMELFKLADAATMDGEGFFTHPTEGLSPFESLSCSNPQPVPIEIVALNLTSAEPFSVSWGPQMAPLDRGVYCAVVHATDNAVPANVEHTAVAGPFAYTFTPSPTPTPTPTPTPSTPPVVNNGAISPISFGGGSVLGASTGQVLGVSCGLYMNQHLKKGGTKNKPDQVTKLQQFLNKNKFGTFTPTGTFGSLTEAAVKAFQNKHADQILKPWNISQPTGLAYLTTIRQLNLLECPELTLPLPTLVPWNANPSAQ